MPTTLLIVAAVAILIILLATASYKVCPADRVMVITGPGGRRFVSGGSAFIIPILTVFDVSQTDPIEQMKPSELEGADALGLVGRMTAWLESKHWRVGHESMGRDVKGYTTMDGSRRIMLNEQNSPRQDAKTILHETAHMLLHQGLPEGEYGRHRGIYETEAESVAYVVAKYMGMDTGEYSIRYVAGWSDADPKLVRSTAEHVRKAADEIITALHG